MERIARMFSERRKNRSSHVSTALGYQLDASARRAQFSSMVLAEEQGLVVAGSGNEEDTEEIAALCPQIASGCDLWHGRVNTARGERMVTIAAVNSPHGRLYLSGVGGSRADIISELRRSTRGVCRILA
ncbi:MAG: hypothetical protein JRI23_05520 [Deltaproteobacteria bacterium]|jgi:hypothetical protein|nr:hypothetical protein [Deltaproteobacteria bacterium]MBW2531012.1 hypothetical protein [Deltaproteobacteria bacterium]